MPGPTEAVMVTGATPATAAVGNTVRVMVVGVGEIRTTEWVSQFATCAECALDFAAIPCGLLTGMEARTEYDVPPVASCLGPSTFTEFALYTRETTYAVWLV